ncbi:MAG: enoyl-CoA hydratase-related protein, partial [Longimicrobiales bacterium]
MNLKKTATLEKQAALTLEVSGDGVAWLVFDRPDHRLNLLTRAVMTTLDALLGEIEAGAAAGDILGVVLRSGKDGTFMAGADIREIRDIETAADGEAASRAGQAILRRLERLEVPTVAAVDGVCLGGGTELILACGHRLATDRPSTRIGLPEVRLGILPGLGGTTRLPRLIGLTQALPLILTGKPVSAKKAARIGLIDEMVPRAALYDRARAVALEAASGAPRRKRRSRPLHVRLLEESSPGRAIVLSQAKKRVIQETRGHYPAPLVALNTLARSAGARLDRAFEIEA